MEKITFNNSVFQNLLENIPGMLYRCKLKANRPMLYISQGCFDLTGYLPEELLNGKVDFAGIIHPNDKDWVWEHLSANLEGAAGCNCEYRIITKGGKQKWVREIANGIYDEQGGLIYIEGYLVDISEKKEHHQIISALEAHVNVINSNERRLRALLNAMPDTLLRIDLNGSCFAYKYENEGFPSVEKEAKDLTSFFPTNIAVQVLDYSRKCIKTGRNLIYEYQLTNDFDDLFFEARFVKCGHTEVVCIIREITDTVKAKKSADEAKEFYESLIDSINVDIAVLDAEDRYLLAGKHGVNDDEVRKWIIGKNDFDYCEKLDIPREIAVARAQMYGLSSQLRKPVEWLEELSGESGNTSFFVRTVKPFQKMSNQENKQYKIVIGLNVTALKVVQNELQRREHLLSFSHKLAQIGYWVWYPKTFKPEWSEVIYEILELDKGQVAPTLKTYYSLIHPDDRATVLKNISEAQKKGEPFSIEFRIKTLSGKIKYIKEQSSCKLLHNKTEEYIFGIVQDITSLKLSQVALAKKEEHFKAIAESSPVLIAEVNGDREITYINSLITRKAEEVIGLPVLNFIADGYKQLFADRLNETFKTGEIQRFEALGLGASNEGLWYDINVGPVKDAEGNVESLVLLAQNITDKKQNELEREKLIKELSHRYNELMQFNYIVSHNLRAPIANILGISYLLNAGLPDEERHKLYKLLISSGESIDALLKDLNDVLSARSPLNENREVVVFAEVIDLVWRGLQAQSSKAKASISINIQPEASLINSIKSYLQSIFHNLLSNAIKYKQEHIAPEIKIEIFKSNEQIILEVSDNGIGINLEQYGGKIFGLYKRFTTQNEGKGLGLHMVKTQVESLGGTITVESMPGEGAKFKIVF